MKYFFHPYLKSSTNQLIVTLACCNSYNWAYNLCLRFTIDMVSGNVRKPVRLDLVYFHRYLEPISYRHLNVSQN
jgi:hypothetical protein